MSPSSEQGLESVKARRLRSAGWRYYRNWLIWMTTWVLLFFVGVWALRASWLWFILWAPPAYFLGSTVYYAFRLTHPGPSLRLRALTPADAGLESEQVEFRSRDGFMLFGWYVPGTNRAAVILVHGGGSRGISMAYHATAMAACGYGVLMFDLRAHGSSEGDFCTGGWREAEDLLGAVDYLRSRTDLEPEQIAVLGISLGAVTALWAAARSDAIAAVVAESPGAGRLDDLAAGPPTLRRRLVYPLNWFSFAVLSFMNGVKPAVGMLEAVKQIAPRPLLLISTGNGGERRFTRWLHEAASEPKALMDLPEAKHGGAYFARPEAYMQQVGAFFDRAFGLTAAAEPATPPERT